MKHLIYFSDEPMILPSIGHVFAVFCRLMGDFLESLSQPIRFFNFPIRNWFIRFSIVR